MGNVERANNIDFRNKSRGNVPLVLGIISILTFFFGVAYVLGGVGLIYGVVDLIKIKRHKQNGKVKTLVGMVCCILGIILAVIFSLIMGNVLFN